MNTLELRSWYLSTHRLCELLDRRHLPPAIAQALLTPEFQQSKIALANRLGPPLVEFIRKEGIRSLHWLAKHGGLVQGARFTHDGQFRGKGFGATNRNPNVTLSANLGDELRGRKLVIEFSKSGLVTDTAQSRLSGSTNLFVLCSVFDIDNATIRAVPYVIGDLVERIGGLSVPIGRFFNDHGDLIESPTGTINWITVSDAARVTGADKGVISRAVDSGQLKGEGTGRDRRICPTDLTRWQLDRAKKPLPQENDDTVRKKLRNLPD